MIIGLDMGGTHIDGVIIEDGTIINTVKKPTNRDNLFQSIWTTLQELLSGYNKSDIKRINLSTTVSTNAIVEDKTSSVGMIIQSGPGLNHDFLACGDSNIFISGYVDHRGMVVEPLDLEEIEKAMVQFNKNSMESYAIVTKFSTRNPSHELEVEKTLGANNPLQTTMGHTISGKLNFPRRVFTSYLNSAVHSTFENFANNIKISLKKEGIDAPIFILKADGGTMNLAMAEDKPVETILSGPAASFMGMSGMLDTDKDAVLLDIGGTTTDIFFLADGIPLFEPLGIKIGKYKTLIRAIYSVSIGLGGDSSIDIVEDELRIGPRREGYPYAFEGPKPTPTDAMIILGLIDDGDKDRAYEAMDGLGRRLNLSPEGVSDLILETVGDIIESKVAELLGEVNNRPVYTVKELLHGKRIEPELINVIGGPAKALAPILEGKLDLPCYYPDDYSVANAVGAALAKPTTEITLLADTSRKILSIPELGVYEKIGKRYDLDSAKQRAISLLEEYAISMGTDRDDIEVEIVEESSFNMIQGFSTTGKNIRIKAQIKPGLIHELGGIRHD
ncbi:MAG: hydantoinase/oxoprolinase family protein [Tissierellia bacterium]|nr:hydantoinase/oxoprolinase family protein [Tissierellia bacterium]